MKFINNIFKLYYHELKTNKKIIVLLTASVLIWLIFCINVHITGKYIGGNFNQFTDLYQKILAGASNTGESKILDSLIKGSINFKTSISPNILMLGAISAISILVSYILVSKDFRKKNSSFYLLYNLPYRTIEIKLSKIMAGLSIYIYTILMITLALLAMDLVNIVHFGGLYSPGIWALTSDLKFLPFNFRYSLFYTFMLVLPSIIGLQSSASLIYAGNNKRRLLKRIIFFILILVSGVLVIYVGLDTNFDTSLGGSGSWITTIPSYIFLGIVYMLVAILFTMDMLASSKAFRGGLRYEDK